MMKLSPIVSEFETLEDADAYDRWLKAKIATALADAQPLVPHDDVMVDMAVLIAREGAR